MPGAGAGVGAEQPLPLGKLPPEALAALLARAPLTDPRVRVGPSVGVDCAVVEVGDRLLVLKSDPITFATDQIGWYLVQVTANDLATTGAVPRWLLLTMLLPEGATTTAQAEAWAEQVFAACRALDISVIGGHTEITYGLNRPLLIGTLVGEVARDRLVTPKGARPGDRLLLTKGVPVEATALLAREFASRLGGVLTAGELAEAADYLTRPGLSVLPEAQAALAAGRVTAMHDPTEGGLSMALWELAEASGHTVWFDPARVPVPPLSRRVCDALGIDPLAALASGALLLAVDPADVAAIGRALNDAGVRCEEIGGLEAGPPAVYASAGSERQPWPRPDRDEVARLFEAEG